MLQHQQQQGSLSLPSSCSVLAPGCIIHIFWDRQSVGSQNPATNIPMVTEFRENVPESLIEIFTQHPRICQVSRLLA